MPCPGMPWLFFQSAVKAEFREGRRSVTRERDWSRITIGLDLGNKGTLALGPVSRRAAMLLLFTCKVEVSIVLYLT